MEKEPVKELSALSASKAKTLENCSWLYWCNYHLKLPQMKNEGAQKGDVCHWIFETLLNPVRHEMRKAHVDKVIAADSITGSKAVERLIKYYIKKSGLSNSTDTLLHIDKMVVVGLKNDFYVKNGKLVAPEFKFDLNGDGFRIKGFIDKPYIVGDKIYIDDFKSAKKKFEGEDQESNMQALFYSYAAKQLWPELTPIVRFIFLQYPNDPMMQVQFNDDVLLGFEGFLKETQKNVNFFNEKTARAYFAADQEPHDKGFNGKLLCGFAKHPDQKKKDGTKMWHCSYRFGYDYYAVKKEDKIVYTVMTEKELKPLKEGEIVEKLHYDGCPRHRNFLDTFSATKVVGKTAYVNVLDDF